MWTNRCAEDQQREKDDDFKKDYKYLGKLTNWETMAQKNEEEFSKRICFSKISFLPNGLPSYQVRIELFLLDNVIN